MNVNSFEVNKYPTYLELLENDQEKGKEIKEINYYLWKEKAIKLVTQDGRLLKYLGEEVQDDPLIVFFAIKNNPLTIRYASKAQVTLFGGSHLIPYPIDQENFNISRFKALMPFSANHFLLKKRKGKEVVSKENPTGKGFDQENVDQAKLIAYDYDLSFKQGKTCIEGGNCFLFISNGARKAIIGNLSLLLSMIALEEQGELELSDEISLSNIEPSSYAFKMARNDYLLKHKKKVLKNFYKKNSIDPLKVSGKEEEIYFRKLLTAPLSKEDRDKFWNRACEFEAKLQLTKRYIAAEIEVSLENMPLFLESVFISIWR
jgi:hypothetical protein